MRPRSPYCINVSHSRPQDVLSVHRTKSQREEYINPSIYIPRNMNHWKEREKDIILNFVPITKEDLLLTPHDLISLKDAGITGGAFAMRSLNQAHLEHLQRSDPESWPPVLVTSSTDGYILIDGYHRWEVARQQHRKMLKATCQAYQNEQEIIEAAFRANLTHGLKASVETKGNYAYWLHVTYPELEQNDIARRVGITQGAVSKAIARRDKGAKEAMQQSEIVDEEAQKRQLKNACRRFTRVATRFLTDVQQLDDTELSEVFNTMVNKEEKAQLARIGRLLMNEDSLSAWYQRK